MIVFYHNDMDGKLAGHWALVKNPKGRAVAVNYNMPFPVSIVRPDEDVWIVDYNPKPEEMLALLEVTKNIVWIDHHKTTLEAYKDFPHEIDGIRDVQYAGCVHTWMYVSRDFDPDRVPYYVRLVGDRDTWTFQYKDDTKYFHYGLLAHKTHPSAKIWKELTIGKVKVKDIIEQGKTVYGYRRQYFKDYLEKWGYEVFFEGHKCLVLGLGAPGSEVFEAAVQTQYDIFLAIVLTGNKWTVSLYSEKVDVGAIAVKYKGGGHTGAAGFQCDELPFEPRNILRPSIEELQEHLFLLGVADNSIVVVPKGQVYVSKYPELYDILAKRGVDFIGEHVSMPQKPETPEKTPESAPVGPKDETAVIEAPELETPAEAMEAVADTIEE